MVEMIAVPAAREAAHLVTRAEAAAALVDPVRPSVAAALLSAFLLALIPLIGTPLTPALVAIAALVGGLTSVLVVLGATYLGGWIGFARASRAWQVNTGHGRAVAYVRATSTGWKLYSVAAWPLGSGAGSVLIDHVITEADAAGRPIELIPSSRRVRSWYRRHGFGPGPRPWSLRHLPPTRCHPIEKESR